MNILLDYFFPITTIEPTPAASTAFLKQVLAIVKPKSGATEDVVTLCTSKSAVDAFTDNVEVDELFNAGMNRVYVLAVDDLLEIGDIIEGIESDFNTILISSDFTDAEMDARVMGAFTGVIGMASTDDAKNATRAVLSNTCAFHSDGTSKAKNMFYAFGKLLSNASSWRNQQYITMPRADDVDTLGEATSLFDDRISFVLGDTEFGPRLGLFCAGGKAITAPYIKKNLELDLQSAALQYVSGNQPEYTAKHAALLEDELQKVVQEDYIDEGLIEAGTVEVTLEEANFVASGAINISEPKALWRIVGEIRQTL
jgi:hypothetical protein